MILLSPRAPSSRARSSTGTPFSVRFLRALNDARSTMSAEEDQAVGCV
jgi:hypothetical protein